MTSNRIVWLMGGAIWLAACARAAVFDGGTSDDDSSLGGSTAVANGGAGGSGGSGGATAGMPCGIDCSTIKTDACHEATCNAATKNCEILPTEGGAPCDDGKFCTTDDICDANGECVGGPMNDCGMSAPDCQSVLCNEVGQSCGLTPAMDGAPCTAADLCKINAVCQGGLCSGGLEKDCFFAPKPDDCHVSQCNPQNGLCEPVAGNDGKSCVDKNDLCTVNKQCSEGSCVGGAAKDCSSQTVGCFDGVCNPQSGDCVSVPIPAGGTCAEASDQCNQGICDNMGNCNPQASNEGQGCNDNSYCSSGDYCSSGNCIGLNNITMCVGGDFCCPQGCTIQTDSDCQPNMVTKDAIERGWWRNTGNHTSNNNNTLTGQTSATNQYNSYFIFDLAGVSGTVITAALKMEIENYGGTDISESMSVWDVSTAAATLEANGNSVPIYTDLMSGNTYGPFVVALTDKGKVLDIPLNAQAVTDINAALGGKFSVGMHVDSLGGAGSEWVRFSASNEVRTHQLVIGVL